MSALPLVLLHHAGGSAGVFAPFVKALPAGIEPVPLELPGRGRRWREPLLTTVDEAVDDLVRAVAGLDGEFAVLGHSLGAYLGLALAARLENDGAVRCTTLFASANAGPVGARLPFEGSPLATTDEEIFTIAEASGGTVSRQVRDHPVLRGRTADLLRADFSLSETFLRHRRRTVTEARIVVCCGTDDVFTPAQLEQWRYNSAAGAETVRFPGGHFYLEHEGPALARAVAERLLEPAPAGGI
ncbi:thioesterase [Streptomyces mashuensis]|uniref:Thioesterase n=1 Tax=Streptomyces mashuensis TaxID=33904 RepID=A0A919AYR8_9ACTN|nr:alpha/beta fold hydrolase [Streptomyces mashuensis]GHF31656.1 thioesterase [Streptomyces mashuensis]